MHFVSSPADCVVLLGAGWQIGGFYTAHLEIWVRRRSIRRAETCRTCLRHFLASAHADGDRQTTWTSIMWSLDILPTMT